MRHLWSLLLALALTPLIYMAAGVSAVRLAEARGLGVTAVVGLGAALVAGALYAVLVMVRLSPVGPVVSGLVYLGVTLWALLDRAGFTGFLPADLFGVPEALHRPVGMGTALLAGPLLFTVFSPRRWRGSEDGSTGPFDAAPNYPPMVSAAPSYTETVASAAPTYAPSSSLPEVTASPAPTYEPPVYTPPAARSEVGAAPTYNPSVNPPVGTPSDPS